MTKIIFYLITFTLLFIGKLQAQDPIHKGEQAKQTFEERTRNIAEKIEIITKEEKEALKTEVEQVNVELEKGLITKEEADEKKNKLAEVRSQNIENKVAFEQENLMKLVQEKVDGKIEKKDSSRTTLIQIDYDKELFKNNKFKAEKRTTSQFVFAFGANNLVTNKAVANSDFFYLKSHFFEWGFTNNTRIFKNYNLLHLKYGFSVMYNNICPTDNRYFAPTANSQTNLEIFPFKLENSRFKNVNFVVPLHLEFDFSENKSKDGKIGFSTHKGLRFGIGGYGGIRIKSKQKMYYNSDDDKIRIKTKGDFNTNDFIYGVSSYIGYRATSLYLKYDLNPLFKNNSVNQNNISLGIRFDLN